MSNEYTYESFDESDGLYGAYAGQILMNMSDAVYYVEIGQDSDEEIDAIIEQLEAEDAAEVTK